MFLILHYPSAFCCKKSTRGPLATAGLFFRSRIVGWVIFFILATTHNAKAQLFDSFDESQPKFRLWQSDAKAQLSPFRKTEPGLEIIETSFGTGSKVYLIYPIEPCAVINDLNASVRILSAQSGLRIGFRVVFPRSTHPATHDPVTEVLFGTPTEGGGRWSESRIASVTPQFEDRVRYLRTLLGPSIDLQDAFIDGVVLSVYSDPGTIKLKVDDLQVDGMVAPTSVAVRESISLDGMRDPSTMSVQEQLRSLQETVPRWILHQGESLDYLKSLGFNAIITNNPNDPLVIEQAARSQMGVIARPPDLVPTESIANDFRHVHGWLIGMTLDQSNLQQTRQLASKLARFPPSMARPTVGEAMEMYGPYSRLSDWLAVPLPITTRVRSASEAAAINQSDLRPLAGRSIPLTSIVTQMPDEWIIQKAIATKALRDEASRLVDYDLLQVRLQFYRSMMQGARGFIFRSGSPLDSGDLTSMARSQGYAGINQEIELFMPWIRAGQSSWQNIATDSPNHTATVLETPNSQLAIVVASGPMDQICSIAPTTDRIKITLPMSGQLRKVFRITHGEMETIRAEQTPTGLLVVIDRPGIIEQIVTVVDSKPVAYLQDQLPRLAPSLVASRIDIAEQVLEIGQMSLVAQRVPSNDPRWEEIRRAQSLHRDSTQYLARSQIQQALKASDQSLLAAQRIVRGSWDEAASQFGAFQSTPLLASPLSLPFHWEFNRLLAGRSWQSLSVPGIPFQDTAQLYQSLWQVDRRLTENVESDCVVGGNGPDGSPTLVLSTKPINNLPIPSGYGGAVMRVSSPPITAPVGAMVHIEGLVRIDSPAGEKQSGLLVCDSIGGESLGQLISSADPSQYAWRRFSLIRFVTNERAIRIHFETRGEMRASIANLKAEMIMPTRNGDLPTRPYSPDETLESEQNTIPVSTSSRR